MSKTKISEFSTTPGNNTDINGINIAEGCAPSGINNAIRELMSDLKEWQSGAMDVYIVPQGTVSAPGVQLYGDLDTGLYGYAANQLGVAVGGTSAGYFSSAGWVGNVNGTITGDINATTIDTTNLEVTNVKAKDGTASFSIANSTGAVSVSTLLNVDNIRIDGNTISATNTNGSVNISGSGTGQVIVYNADVQSGQMNSTTIGATTPSSGAFTTLSASSTATLNTLSSSGATLTGGTINGMAIGGVTPAAGAFTTISASGNATLSGGTANAVLYLNASKVVTSGSAFQFDGTNLTVGAGVTSMFYGPLVVVGNTTLDTVDAGVINTTTTQVTNIKAKDGTASIVLTNTTGAVDFSKAVTMSATTQNIALGTSQTSGTFTVGGASQTGTQTFDQSTKTHTLNVGAGATESAATKTINIGTAGVSGSTTAINIGSTNGTTVTLNGTVNATTVNVTTLDLTNIEVTNIKAKDGTASITLADSTGVASFSANPILSGGTANGVTYLNASKSLTSGSALTFDGTTLTVNANIFLGTTQRYIYQTGSANLNLQTDSGDVVWLRSNGSSEAMRLNGTGLGIGTSSPAYKLDVTGTAGISGNVTLSGGTANGVTYLNGSKVLTSGSALTFDGTTTLGLTVAGTGSVLNGYNITNGTASGIFKVTGSTYSYRGVGSNVLWIGGDGNSMYVGTSTNHPLLFGTNAYELMRLDTSGNLGLGVTPSNAGTYKLLQLPTAGQFGTAGTTAFFTANAYLAGAGTWTYASSNLASRYSQDAGAHSWSTAASGTAGNAITFTQALTLDANRNLLLNGTSAGASSVGTLTIFNGTAPTGSVTDGVILYAQDVSSSSELKVRDEAGNVTTLSPHNFSLIPDGPSEEMAWAYYSEKGGKRINVDMLKLARMVEKLTGEKLVYES